MNQKTTISMNVPVQVASYLKGTDETMQKDQTALMMFPYIKNGLLSYGRVAELLEINKYDLIATYERFNIPYIDITIEDALEDVETCMKFIKRKEQSK